MHVRPDIHTQSYLTTVCVLFFVYIISFFFVCFFEGVVFSEYFCTMAVFSLYGEYVVRFPPLLDGVFLLCDRGLDF